jgi:GTPase
MAVPQVVIVGRPNVGKSSLLNWLADKRISIVDDKAGVTRDRVSHLMEYCGRFFELVDTGGIGIIDDDNLTRQVEEQIDAALETADIVLFVVDTRTGMLPLDSEVARRLRYIDKPMICVANKTDDERLEPQADEFYKLGRGKLVKVSTHQNRGRLELLDMIHERLPDNLYYPVLPEQPAMKIAIVGRRNTGKSTLVNTLAKAERMIVSEVPGTTRDSVGGTASMCDLSWTARSLLRSTRRACGGPRAFAPTSIFTALTGPSGASAGQTWSSFSSTARSGCRRWISSFASTSPISTSRASSS